MEGRRLCNQVMMDYFNHNSMQGNDNNDDEEANLIQIEIDMCFLLFFECCSFVIVQSSLAMSKAVLDGAEIQIISGVLPLASPCNIPAVFCIVVTQHLNFAIMILQERVP